MFKASLCRHLRGNSVHFMHQRIKREYLRGTRSKIETYDTSYVDDFGQK